MQIQPLSNQEYNQLGRRLVIEEPQVAHKLLSVLPQPTNTDTSQIVSYYSKFCQLNRMPHRKREVYEFRILFIACILSMYNPSALINPEYVYTIRSGVVRELSILFGIDNSGASRWVRKTIIAYKVYEMEEQVKKIMQDLTINNSNVH